MPKFSSWIVQWYDWTVFHQQCANVGAFFPIAIRTSVSQVFKAVGAIVLSANDVLHMKGKLEMNSGFLQYSQRKSARKATNCRVAIEKVLLMLQPLKCTLMPVLWPH
jgi:hypothetical protein